MVVCIVDPESKFDAQLVEAILLLDSWVFACTEKARLSKRMSGLIKHVISRPWRLSKPSGKSSRLGFNLTDRKAEEES